MPGGVRDVQRVCVRRAERGRDAKVTSDASAAGPIDASECAECARYAWCTDYVAVYSADTGTFASVRARPCSGPSICGRRCAADGGRAHR